MAEITILDCYTDEPSGLGVPPYIGTYPRYLAGYYYSKGYEVNYMTIDDLRKLFFQKSKGLKTDIRQYNFSENALIKGKLIAIIGVHTPGKYLSALPGTIHELTQILEHLKIKDVEITGPAIFGTQLEGGKFSEKKSNFNYHDYNFSYNDIKKFSILGAKILSQIKGLRIAEIETAKGCKSGQCSFCLEPIKSCFEIRSQQDIIDEITSLYNNGCRYFRLGKQTDFYVIDKPVLLLKTIREKFPDIKVLHIDNVNPNSVLADKKNNNDITKAIVKYCTEGNIAAFGVESFDKDVIKKNLLNSTPETVYQAVKILNEFGKESGANGMPKYLPGLNIILGLGDESKKTFQENFDWLKRMLDENLFLRRINIRQVSIFPGTLMEKIGNKSLKKNRKYYYSFREKIRNQIDFLMLAKVIPIGTILKEVRMEVHDGNTTFGRQMGSYPIIVGVKQKLELHKFYSVKVTAHMLRSITGEVYE